MIVVSHKVKASYGLVTIIKVDSDRGIRTIINDTGVLISIKNGNSQQDVALSHEAAYALFMSIGKTFSDVKSYDKEVLAEAKGKTINFSGELDPNIKTSLSRLSKTI